MTNKYEQSQLGLIYQTHDLIYGIKIILWKANKKKYIAEFQTNLVLKDEIKK